MHKLTIEPLFSLTDEYFEKLCKLNPNLVLERNGRGNLIVMSPTGGESGARNSVLNARVVNWALVDGSGIVFDSSTMFRLPNGALRMPDVCWIAKKRWNLLTAEEKRGYPPIAPDFVIELRSWSDDLEELREKMEEYKENGVRLGWLLDPFTKNIEIYRIGREKQILNDPKEIFEEEILPGFILRLEEIF